MLQELIQQINDTIDEKINCVHTAIPGTIISYNAENGLATVLPAMKFRKSDGTTLDYPHITGVPVVFPQAMGQQTTIAYPIKSGDGCLVIIAEQSIDYWLYGQETDTSLAHDLTNAICIPGLFTKANSLVKEACENNSIILNVKDTRLSVKHGEIILKADAIKLEGQNVTVNGKSIVW